jgi:hypothetical protein
MADTTVTSWMSWPWRVRFRYWLIRARVSENGGFNLEYLPESFWRYASAKARAEQLNSRMYGGKP